MKKLAQGAIATGSGTLAYTVPASYRTDVRTIDVCNTTAAPLTCAIHLVPAGASAATSNMLFPTVTIPGNTMVNWQGIQTLNAGDFIQAIGSASGLTMNITGDEMRASL